MDYSYLDKEEYKDIPLLRIENNKNGLPFLITRLNKCANKIHRHQYIQIIYLCKGKLKHLINNNMFEIHKGDIFIIPPYVPHYFISDNDENYEYIEFEFVPEFINERYALSEMSRSFFDFAYLEPFLVIENVMKPGLNLTGSAQKEVEGILNEVLMEYEARESDFSLIIKALLLKLLVVTGREFKRNLRGSESQGIFERHRNALLNAIEFLDENFQREVTIEETSKVAMLSQSYFRYLFKHMTGKTFVEYLNSLRIMKAIDILKASPDRKVLDICHEVGFNNVNHFNRIFRQETGTTPMHYRKC